MAQKPYIVGITGGSASGKTLFLNSLLKAFTPNELCLVSQDNYYKPLEEQTVDENGVINFDIPSSIESELYAQHIWELHEGRQVLKQEYTFNNPNIIPRMFTFTPCPIVVVEGIFVFYFPEVAKLFDLKVFIDASEHIKLKRRIIRDRDERGDDLETVLYRYEKHVAPTYEKYIAPFKYDADMVVPNNTGFDKALEMLIIYLKSKVEQSH
jgi:uridine kinase